MRKPVTSRIQGSPNIVDAAEAASLVPDDATVLVSGFGSVGYPKAVPLALAESDRNLSLTIVSGGSTGAEIDSELAEADAVARRFPYQARPEMRAAVNDGTVAFHDRHVSQLGDEVQYGSLVAPDVAVVEAIAVGPDWLIPSTSIGQTPAFVESVDRLIVEVNESQPLGLQHVHDVYRPGQPPNREPIPLTDPAGTLGDARVRFDPDTLTAVVQTDRPDSPYSFRDPTAADQEIARHFAEFFVEESKRTAIFEDTVHLQFGVGSLGNALTESLSTMDLGDRDLVYFGEVIQDGLLEMIDAGQLSGASATTLALSANGQEKLFSDIEEYANDIVLRPTDISNNAALIDRFGVVAVNSALEVDIFGHVNSTHVNGTKLINGIGGSADFSRNAFVSVIALPSTASGGDISRIIPMAPHVDHTEHETDVVITEHGIADLRGLSPAERASEMVASCADPRYREDLREYLERGADVGHIPHDIETSYSWTTD